MKIVKIKSDPKKISIKIVQPPKVVVFAENPKKY